MGVIIRVRSMSEDRWHSIEVEPSIATCSCMGLNWCSHIDAVLMCGERYMVHPEDRKTTDKVAAIIRPKLIADPEWKAHWRSNRRWRGLPVRRSRAEELLHQGMPVVSVEGTKTQRTQASAIAEEHGWAVTTSASKGCLVHISRNPDGDSTQTNHARRLGIMITSHEDWPTIAPIGHILHSQLSEILAEKPH